LLCSYLIRKAILAEFHMSVLYPEALVALLLSILMVPAWTMQPWIGNSGWVGTIRTFAAGLVEAAGALLAAAGAPANARQRPVATRLAPAARATPTARRARAGSCRSRHRSQRQVEVRARRHRIGRR
jgi:hypothetical protein